jgi:adenylate kinase
MIQTTVCILLGRPGSGKGTQGELLREQLGYAHISTGEILRNAIREHTELGLMAQGFVEAGNLVPDALILSLISERMHHLVGQVPGIIFDGFPRTLPQAVAFQEVLLKFGIRQTVVVELKLPHQVASKRIEFREASNGGQVRVDDKDDVVVARMAVFERETQPVINHYEQLGVLVSIEGSGSREEVFARVKLAVVGHDHPQLGNPD